MNVSLLAQRMSYCHNDDLPIPLQRMATSNHNHVHIFNDYCFHLCLALLCTHGVDQLTTLAIYLKLDVYFRKASP